MNKKKKFTVGAIIIASVLGIGVYQAAASQAEETLSTDEVRKLIADQYPGKVTELELEKEQGNAVYEVEILGEDKKYDLKLDGSSGKVLHLKEKPVTKQDEKTNDNQANNQNSDNKVNTEQNGKKSSDKVVIEAKKAEEIALKEFDGTITSIDLDEDDGHLRYEIEIRADKKEADVEIDAYTGEVVIVSIEEDDDKDDKDDDNDDSDEDKNDDDDDKNEED